VAQFDAFDLEQLEALGKARRYWARVSDEDSEADVSIDLTDGTVDFGDMDPDDTR
jgi:hypothetical protein